MSLDPATKPDAAAVVQSSASRPPVAAAERYQFDETDPRMAPKLPPKTNLDDFRRYDGPDQGGRVHASQTPVTDTDLIATAPRVGARLDQHFPTLVARELARARELHPDPHENPFDSFLLLRKQWSDLEMTYLPGPVNAALLKRELLQLAAMCQRAAEDLHLVKERC